MITDSLRDELDALTAIFPIDELSITFDITSVIIHISGSRGVASLFVDTQTYPETPPNITFEGLRRSEKCEARATVDALGLTLRGDVMLFQLITHIRESIGGTSEPDVEPLPLATSMITTASPEPLTLFPVMHGVLVLEKKSTFQAHVASVSSLIDVKAALETIKSIPRVMRATHNIFAYRFTLNTTGGVIADNDDDGEDAAGGKLAELLSNIKAENVLVVVSRWFGGILLGPSRFGIINNCARTLLVEGGFERRN